MTDVEKHENFLQKATEIMRENLHEFTDDMTDEELDIKVRELINQKLISK
jgi:divalent metal cation (Fe/Co/Zn/Cd) transporter